MYNRPAIVRSPKKAAHLLLEAKLVATERVLKKYWKRQPIPTNLSALVKVRLDLKSVKLVLRLLQTTLANM